MWDSKSIQNSLRRFRTRCTATRCIIVLGIAIPAIYGLSILFGSPPAICISESTTRLLYPLTPDGRYIDYAAAMRQRYQGPGLVKLQDDPWFILTFPERNLAIPLNSRPPAYSDPWVALSGRYSEATLRQRWNQRLHVPFGQTDDPELAAIITNNSGWYDAFSATKPVWPGIDFTQRLSDGTARIDGIGNALGALHLEIIRRFAILGMLQLGEGRQEAAMVTTRTMLMVADRDRHSPGFHSLRRSFGLMESAHDIIWVALLGSQDIRESDILSTLSMPVDTQLASTIVDRWDFFVRFDGKDQRGQASLIDDWQLSGYDFRPLIDGEMSRFMGWIGGTHTMRYQGTEQRCQEGTEQRCQNRIRHFDWNRFLPPLVLSTFSAFTFSALPL